MVFDVWNTQEERFLRPDEWMDAVKLTGLMVIDHIEMNCDYDILDHLIKQLDPQKDKFEGYVIKNFNCVQSKSPTGRLYGKLYHPATHKLKSAIFEHAKYEESFQEEAKLLQE